MVTESVTFDIIRNKACIVCGAAFRVPRAGKLYCSHKCKQFNYYHRVEISRILEAKKGISDDCYELCLKEFTDYSLLVKNLNEYKSLLRRMNSRFLDYTVIHESRFQQLDCMLPNYVKNLDLIPLSIEKWSFIKLLYLNMKKEEFLKLIDSLGNGFFNKLLFEANEKSKNSIANLYRDHILKIVSGKVHFR